MSTQRIEIDTILEKVTVRINTSANGNKESGTGVIVKNKKNDYFVITAAHCIYGKGGNMKPILDESKVIEVFHHSERIDVKEIYNEYISEDIILLSIKNLNGRTNQIGYQKGLSSVYGQDFHFCGYPAYRNGNSDIYPAKGGKTEKNCFHIQCGKLKDMSGNKEAYSTSGGLSGSGIFCIMNNKLCLMGILTDLVDSEGIFGLAIARKLDKVFEKFEFDVESLPNHEFYKDRLKEIDEKSIAIYIDSLKNNKNKYFDHLYRKCKTLYGEEAEETIVKLVRFYHQARIDLGKLKKQNPNYNQFSNELYNRFESLITQDYNHRPVNGTEEAQKLYQEIRNKFELLFQKMISYTKYNLEIYDDLWRDEVVIYFLMKCTLDFKQHGINRNSNNI